MADALRRGGVVDISTTGRKTGKARRIEIVFHNLDGDFYISGRPGPRDWFANMLADPSFTLHLRRGLDVDLRAISEPVTDAESREPLLLRILTEGFKVELEEAKERLPTWTAEAPLVKFVIED